ncbi:MAG TPA: hypothetical protein VFC19_54380 [Candidatus Limnocylindrales bacterium]|nr:hypothetical protein [Candidatus Limnocylindrales bacterium]
MTASAAIGAFFPHQADTPGLRHLSWFLIAIAAAYLVITLADRSLATVGRTPMGRAGAAVEDRSGTHSGPGRLHHCERDNDRALPRSSGVGSFADDVVWADELLQERLVVDIDLHNSYRSSTFRTMFGISNTAPI